jgi:flagellar hook-length control protein FliK
MNATGLPLPAVAAATAPTAETSATTAANAPAETDFVTALAQMVGANVSGDGKAPKAKNAQALDEAYADVLALLSLPAAPATPQAQLQATVADPLELLGLAGQSQNVAARNAAILQALAERLANVTDDGAPETPMHASAMGAAESAPLRAAVSEALTQGRGLQQPVGTQAWADELGTRLTMMTEKGHHTASLRLTPEHLGPLEVRISMRDDQASVWFGAAHADTRAAIEHALPRLRELFAAQGMSLADAGVFREPPKQQASEWTGPAGHSTDDAALTEVDAAPAKVQVGLVDAYA